MFADTPINFEFFDQIVQDNIHSIYEWDDEEGYLKINIGEKIANYQIVSYIGKGVFSNVVKVKQIDADLEYAIKILRSEEIFMRAGKREAEYLKKLNDSDPNNKKHIIRYYGNFEHKKHLCLVFELMERDIRETVKLYGKKIGLSLEAVRVYAKQLFLSLSHMNKQGIIHADLKPDNLLCDSSSKIIKLCDFGSAFPIKETILVDELQSRFYRAPEVILGCPYDTGIDMWSAGCSLFEIYTGKFLFPGSTQNEMLKFHQQLKGKFKKSMLKKGEFTGRYFDNEQNFLSIEKDPLTQTEYIKPIKVTSVPTKDLSQRLIFGNISYEDQTSLLLFKDLLDKTLILDPQKRITPEQALEHPFIKVKK